MGKKKKFWYQTFSKQIKIPLYDMPEKKRRGGKRKKEGKIEKCPSSPSTYPTPFIKKNICIIKTARLEKTKAGHLLQREGCNILFYLLYCFFTHLLCALLLNSWSWQKQNEKNPGKRVFFSLLIYLSLFFSLSLFPPCFGLRRFYWGYPHSAFSIENFSYPGAFFFSPTTTSFNFFSLPYPRRFSPSAFCLNRLLLEFSLFLSLG